MTIQLFRERIGKKELLGKNCSAMDEFGDFKFTSVEKLLEFGRQMEFSGGEFGEFVIEQQEYEQRMREFEEEKREHEQWKKEFDESERKRKLD